MSTAFVTAPAARARLATGVQWRRLREISTVLWSSGFGWVVDAVGLQACVSLRCRLVCSSGLRPCPHHVAMADPLPRRLVAVLERLGPTFVKIGQLLATRTDYLPAAYAEALRSLHADVPAFPAQRAKAILEAELGRPLPELFSEFDDVPFAAASLSQVHRARRCDGTAVAVKVQRPGVSEQVEADLALLGWLARRLERRRGDTLAFRPTVAVDELAAYTWRELDFRREARTADAVGRMFTAQDDVVIPRVHWDLTTARVLTTDLVIGKRPARRAELAAVGLDADRLLAVGAQAMLRQIFEFGLFHADPHPGNLLLLDGNRVCFLDFGLFGRIDRRERRRMAMVLYALVGGDYDTVADQLLHVSGRLPGADVRGFRAAVGELVESWYGRRSGEFSVARLLLGELSLGAHFGVTFPRELMLLARALVHLEATASVIDPDLGFADLLDPLLPDLRRILLPRPQELEQLVAANQTDYLALALELPEMLPHLRDVLAADRGAASPAGGVHAPTGAGWATSVVAGLVGAVLAGTLSRRQRAS